MKNKLSMLIIAGLMLSFGSAALALQGDGLIGYWSFDDPNYLGRDASNNGNDGTIYGPTWISGKISGALNFDGDDYVDCGNGSNLNIGTGDFSIVFWVRVDDSQWNSIIYKTSTGSTSSDKHYRIHAAQTTIGDPWQWPPEREEVNSIVITVGDNNGGAWYINWQWAEIKLGEWQHIAWVLDRDSGSYLYVNGVLKSTLNVTSSIDISNTGDLIIGKGPERALNGSIDEVRIYNRALNGNEVNDIYTGHFSSLSETSSAESASFETLSAKQGTFQNGAIIGDLNGVIDFNQFDILTISTGPWAGKGFSNGLCTVKFEDVNYTGNWHGIVLPDANSSRMNLKGSIDGEILATVEGTMVESVPESGIYDQYQATWKIGRLGTIITSATVNVTGIFVDQNNTQYPATGLYILQTAMDGNVAGDYNGPVSTVINHVRIADGNNPYNGQGFSYISYVSQSGSGEGLTYDIIGSPRKLKGLFSGPLAGTIDGILDETTSPRMLSLRVNRIDLGLPPAPDLKVEIWGPTRVSPGQTINYIVEYRNDGLVTAQDIKIDCSLDPALEYLSASQGVLRLGHELTWIIDEVRPQERETLSVRVRVPWGLPMGTKLCQQGRVTFRGGRTDSNVNNLLANGINTPPGSDGDNEMNKFANLVDADRIPGLYTSGDGLSDACDVQKGTPIHYYGVEYDSDGNPCVRDPIDHQLKPVELYLDNFQTILDTGEGPKAMYFTANGNNGLDYLKNHKEELQTVSTFYAYSGGTRTALTAVLAGFVKCKTLVLISPMCGVRLLDFNYTWEKEMEWLHEKGINVVIYQSQHDYVAKELLSWLFQVHYGSSDIDWLKANNILVNPGAWDTDVDGSPDSPPLKIHDLIFEIDQEEINNKGHTEMDNYVFGSIHKETVSEFCSEVQVARDPSVKYGPEGNVLPGQKLNYKVEYENEGEGIAFGVYFTDTLDEDVNDSTLDIGPIIDVNTGAEIAPPGIYNPATRTITWFAGEVGPGQGGYSDFSVNVKGDANDGTEIINYATIYFPSVPEETRTNGIVSIVSLNQPPVANAGPDQTIERTSVAGAEVQLDGSSSNDTDGDPLTYEWTWAGGSASGVKPVVTLSMGLTTITLTVSAGNLTDTDTVDITIVDTTPPAVTIKVPQVNASVQSVLTLTAQTSDFSGVVSVYFSIREPDSGTGVPMGQENLPATFNSVSDNWECNFDTTQLKDGSYVVLTKALDASANVGWSNIVPFSICNLVAPASINYPSSSSTGIYTVSWSLSTGATSYQLERSSNAGSTWSQVYSGANISYTENVGNGSYRYCVKATNTSGSSGWTIGTVDCIVTIPPPSPPTGVSASDGTYTDKVRVSWNASSGATGYEVWRYTQDKSCSASKIADVTSSPYDDTSAVAKTIYWYWVKAKNSSGTSNFSNDDSGYRAAIKPPSPPTGVSASDGTYTDKVRVSWNASSGATGYEVWRYTQDKSCSASKIADVTSSPYDNTSAVAKTIYWYWVKAKNSAGTSGFSNDDSGYRAVPPPQPPIPPASISYPPSSSTGKYTVSWPSSTGSTSYQLERSSNAGSTWSQVYSGANISYTENVGNGSYRYRVKATNAGGPSGWTTGTLDCVVNIPPSPPLPPTGVSATDGTYKDRVRVTWNVSTGATSYEIWRNTSIWSNKAIKIAEVTSLSYDDTSAVAKTTYWYWVKAKNSSGTSNFSNGDSGKHS